MRRTWILTSLGSVSIAGALAVGLTPVHDSLLIATTEWGPGGRPTISCGSPLLKKPPSYSAPFEGIRLQGNDPCSVRRDHRLLPVKILGGAGLLVLGAATADALWSRRRKTVH